MPVPYRASSALASTRGRRLLRRSGRFPLTVAVASALVALAPSIPAHAATATCHGVRATIVGTGASDVIHGTAGRDVIVGLGGNDTIYAKGGNDLVCGGAGADRLFGGSGDDRLYGGKDRLHHVQEDGVERDGDTLRGGRGNDRMFAGADDRSADIVVFDVISWAGSAHGVRIDLRTGTTRGEGVDTFSGGTFTVEGSAHRDVVEGTNRRDRIDTGAGADVVRARGGNDIVNVGTYPHPGRAAAQVWGGRGNDRVTATESHVRIWGGTGNDWIEAGGKQSQLWGGPGDDHLQGGNSTLAGGAGDDDLTGLIGDAAAFDGGPGSDYIQLDSTLEGHREAASTGTWNMATGDLTFTLGDTIRLSAPNLERASLPGWGTAWTVTGTPGDDYVGGDWETSSPVTFYGLGGDDTFRGTEGDDVFDGGAGDDTSYGMGAGDDSCISVETIEQADCEHVS
jgi:Ca2+-binding RTX toxin-like protein